MRFGTLHTTLLIFICLNFQLSYSQTDNEIKRTSEFKKDVVYGQDCDDTEYRDYKGYPAWKGYGGWLSECDSIRSVNLEKEFAERRKIKDREKAIQDSIDLATIDDDIAAFDMNAMWEQAEWEEIQDITTVYFETEQITAVAGVRGAEAEDEALAHLYYRKSMKGISIEDYKKAYGKLKNTRDDLFSKYPNHPKLERMDILLLEIKNKIKSS